MRIEQLIKLVNEAAEGKDNFKEGAVGSNGYGFVFKDLSSGIPFITDLYSQKYSEAGSMRRMLKLFKKVKDFKLLSDISDEKRDLLLVGSLKTLIPTLQFGGLEMLFDAWMFVKTPENQIFPATFYWGQSGLSVGGWSSYDISSFVKERIWLEDLLEIINFTPFNFTDGEEGCFLDALEFALKKVPVSDFWGVFNHDLGNLYMAVSRGDPIIYELGEFKSNPDAEKELEPLLGKNLTDVSNESFTISLLPGGYTLLILRWM